MRRKRGDIVCEGARAMYQIVQELSEELQGIIAQKSSLLICTIGSKLSFSMSEQGIYQWQKHKHNWSNRPDITIHIPLLFVLSSWLWTHLKAFTWRILKPFVMIFNVELRFNWWNLVTPYKVHLGHHCSGNSLRPLRHQYIIRINVDFLSIGFLGTSSRDIFIKIIFLILAQPECAVKWGTWIAILIMKTAYQNTRVNVFSKGVKLYDRFDNLYFTHSSRSRDLLVEFWECAFYHPNDHD